MANSRKDDQPQDWLTRIQEQSWEPEIFISGIVLYALYQIPNLIYRLEHFLTNKSLRIFSAGTVDETLISLLLVANIWLIVGFTAHLFFRSVWVAFLGLNYVYRKGIQTERLKFQERYNRLLFQEKGFDSTIHQLEKLCSATFAISFLLFMTILGLCFALSILALIIALTLWLFPNQVSFNWLDPVLILLTLIFVIDFVTVGGLKRIPYFSKAYYPIYRFMSWVTLSPLYRRIYYGLVSNHSKWKSGGLILSFIIISFFMANSIRNENNIADLVALRLDPKDNSSMYYGNYENLMKDDPSNIVQIQSDIISSNVLRVFIVHRTAFEKEHILPLCQYEQRKDSVPEDSLIMTCLNSFYDLEIDTKAINPPFYYQKRSKTRQEGVVAYVDIKHLKRGMHELSIIYNFQDKEGNTNPIEVSVVQFYRELPAVRSDSTEH
jgi:hypothetical protein